MAHDLREALDLLTEFPGIGTKVENTKSQNTRRWLLKRISYHVYYRAQGDLLEIVALWGTDRERTPRI